MTTATPQTLFHVPSMAKLARDNGLVSVPWGQLFTDEAALLNLGYPPPKNNAHGQLTPQSVTIGPLTFTGGILTATSGGTIGSGSGTVTSIGSTTLTIGGTSSIPTVDLSGAQVTDLALAATSLQPIGGLGGSYTYASLTLNAAGQITAVLNGVQPVTSITSTSLTIAGTTAVPTINLSATQITNLFLAATALQPVGSLTGSYTNVSLTINTLGQITAVSSGAAGAVGANPTALVGLVAVNGVATTFMRSDAAPPIDQTIAPTWTGKHTFTPSASNVAIKINSFAGNYGIAISAALATSFSAIALQQAGATTAVIGSDGTQGILSDSVNGDLCLGATDGVVRIGTLNGPTKLKVTATAIAAPTTPLVSTITQVATGLANKKTADSTSNSAVLTADAALTVTINETGYYRVEVFLAFYEPTLGTGGFQFDFNAGTATLGGLVLAFTGYSNAVVSNTAITAVGTNVQTSVISTNAAAPSWYLIDGAINVTVIGTFGLRWAQNTLSANLTTLKALSHIMLTKIG